MRPLKEKISITVDGDLLKKARRLAELDERSLFRFITLALKDYVSKIEEQENKYYAEVSLMRKQPFLFIGLAFCKNTILQ